MTGKEVKDAAWYYPEPKKAAENIKDHVAFCKICLAGPEPLSLLTKRVDKNKVEISMG